MDKKMILVVDDDAATIDILEETLRSFGCKCRTANSGFKALELIRKETFGRRNL